MGGGLIQYFKLHSHGGVEDKGQVAFRKRKSLPFMARSLLYTTHP